MTLGAIEDEDLCPVKTTYSFVTKTAHLRESLHDDHTLFLAYIDSPQKLPMSVRPTTVTNWVKETLGKAGINTKDYQAHSVRAASSTKAVELGHSIQEVKKHANWSLNSNTFENFYYKPSSQTSSSTAITNSIFSSPEKRIT